MICNNILNYQRPFQCHSSDLKVLFPQIQLEFFLMKPAEIEIWKVSQIALLNTNKYEFTLTEEEYDLPSVRLSMYSMNLGSSGIGIEYKICTYIL